MKQNISAMKIGVASSFAIASSNTIAFDPSDPLPDIVKGSITIELQSIVTGVVSPNFLTDAGDGTDRLFLV